MSDEETYEEDVPFEKRLRLWLLEQPEYLTILALDRPLRRSGMRRVANIILTFPEADVQPGANRKEQRAAMVQLKRQVSKKLDKAQQKKARKQRQLDAGARRIKRLSQARFDELDARYRAQAVAQQLLEDDTIVPQSEQLSQPLEVNLLTDEHRQEVLDATLPPHDPALD